MRLVVSSSLRSRGGPNSSPCRPPDRLHDADSFVIKFRHGRRAQLRLRHAAADAEETEKMRMGRVMDNILPWLTDLLCSSTSGVRVYPSLPGRHIAKVSITCTKYLQLQRIYTDTLYSGDKNVADRYNCNFTNITLRRLESPENSNAIIICNNFLVEVWRFWFVCIRVSCVQNDVPMKSRQKKSGQRRTQTSYNFKLILYWQLPMP